MRFMAAANKQLDSFDGLKDEVQAFDEALTDAQVYALYKSRSGSIMLLQAIPCNSINGGVKLYHLAEQ